MEEKECQHLEQSVIECTVTKQTQANNPEVLVRNSFSHFITFSFLYTHLKWHHLDD